MASINAVYSTLKNLVNKDQKGFVTPAVFNSFAGLAQTNIYNRLFDDLNNTRKLRRQAFDAERDKSLEKRIKEDLSVFAKNATIEREAGFFAKPSNFSRAISATTFGSIVLGQSTRTPIEMLYDEEKIERILRSNLHTPTEDYPIALMSDDIEVYPQSINRIQLRYYKNPQSKRASDGELSANSPSYGYQAFGTTDVFDSQNSYDFELPDHYVNDLVVEIAGMIGVNLRDSLVQGYAGMAANR